MEHYISDETQAILYHSGVSYIKDGFNLKLKFTAYNYKICKFYAIEALVSNEHINDSSYIHRTIEILKTSLTKDLSHE